MSLKEFDAASGHVPGEELGNLPSFGDRIRVDQVNLYVDPTLNVVQRIALEQLIESPVNPRTHFDQAALQQLADTISSVGVMQPILVRPVDYASLVRDGEPVQAYEIIFGHRRYRASKLAGKADIPCIVRPLNEAHSAQLQSIENVQREDLSPMEAARGYQQYLQAHGVSKDELAKEIGLSRSHVYGYLKLLTAVPVIQDAVQKGEIGPDVAIKIARLHTPKLQERALVAIKGKYYDLEDGGKKSVRQIQKFLAEKFTLDLKGALFDPKDATLLADAGACTACTKRSGNAPEFEDLARSRVRPHGGGYLSGQPNLCTDPDCFEAKKKAHLSIEAGKLAAKGKAVIEGNKARAAIGADGQVKGAYIALKDVKAQVKKAGKAAADLPVVVIQNPRDGKTVEAIRVDDAKAAGVKVKEPAKNVGGGRYDYQAAQKQRQEEDARKQAKAAEETRVNLALLAAVRQAAAGAPLSVLTLQLVVAAAVKGVSYEQRGVLAQLHECKSVEALEKKVCQMPADRLTTLLLDCALVEDVRSNAWRPQKPEALLAAAKHYGVDIEALRKDVASKPADTVTKDLLDDDDTPDLAGATGGDADMDTDEGGA